MSVVAPRDVNAEGVGILLGAGVRALPGPCACRLLGPPSPWPRLSQGNRDTEMTVCSLGSALCFLPGSPVS